jgi:ABC-2 type transport system permease protein
MSSFLKIKALFIKEFIQIRRDRMTFGMMVMMPIIQLILFGFAINNDPRGLPMGVLIYEESVFSRNIIKSFENSSYFKVTQNFTHENQANLALKKGDISFLLTIPAGLERGILRGDQPQILLEADATDPGTVGGALGAIPQLINQSLALDMGRYFPQGAPSKAIIDVVVHRNYNPESITAYSIVPGLIGTILSMTMIMMTAIALTRESEKGTMENLLSMPFSPFDIMVGKITPYILIGFMQFLVIMSAGHLLFSIPIQGSLILAAMVTLLYITANLLVGYVFSTIVKTQLQAMQLTFFFFLPSLLLSGFMFPFFGMPVWAQYIGNIFPITHFLRIIRGILLKDSGLDVLYSDIFAIFLFILATAFIAVKRFRKTLD